MTTKEFHLAFNIRLDKEDVIGYPSFTPEEIDFWLTQAVYRFVKQRYTGNDGTQSDGFQSTERIDEDLRNTIEAAYIKPDKVSDTKYKLTRPEDFWYSVGEDAYIVSSDRRWPRDGGGRPLPKLVDPLRATLLTSTGRKADYLSEFNLNANNARPVRTSIKDGIYYETDGTYSIDHIDLTYIRKPDVFNFRNPNDEYKYIPEHAHDEIVSIAIMLALNSVESDRYLVENQLQVAQE